MGSGDVIKDLVMLSEPENCVTVSCLKTLAIIFTLILRFNLCTAGVRRAHTVGYCLRYYM